MRSSRCALLVPILAAIAVSASAADQRWIEVQSPHFSVVTDAGEKKGREVAFHFEQMRSVYGTLMTRQKVNLPIPMQIVAFRNSKEMRQFAPLWQGKPTEVDGLFVAGSDQCFIMLDMSGENPWQVVFHEYAHQLMNGNLTGSTAPWFEEGFAEYFSSIEVDSKQARVGKVPQDEYRVLQQMGTAKVVDLFRVQHNSSTYNESGSHRSVFYAESGMMVHYLYDNQLIPKLADYFALANDQNVPVETAIQKAFGMSAADFDRSFHEYVSSGRFRYSIIQTPSTINPDSYLVSNLSVGDAQSVLADLHLHSFDYRDKAVAEFQDVLKSDPNNFSALRGLGFAYLTRRDFANAHTYFSKAAAANPDDPRVLYYSALLVQEEQGIGLGTDRERLKLIQQQLEKAVSLSPEFADAYCLLAFTYSSQGKNKLGLKTMYKAVELNPKNEAYWLNLATMLIVNEQFDQASTVLDRLTRSSDPAIASRASRSLSQIPEARVAAAQGIRLQAPNSTPENHGDTLGSGSAASDNGAGRLQNSSQVRWAKGKLVSVDCSKAPEALAILQSGATSWKLHIADNSRLIVIGADKFSCDWKNQEVAVNFRETGPEAGEMMSLELQ